MSVKVDPSVLLGDLSTITGPFFLGFAMETFGMGVVFVLAVDYLLSVASRRKLPSESPRRLGVALVAITLAVTMAQTIMDLNRGFRMFGTNFASIGKFLTPDSLWFWSPFLGIVSAVFAQCFLLRRIVRFISSLELLWPILSRKAVKYTFTTGMLLAIVMSAVAGNLASHVVSESGGLASIGFGGGGSTEFQIYSGIWLGTAVAVDCILCSILCVELWWARRKLSIKGTTMQEFMTRLILITFHGGAAVTGLQTATLLLYYYQRTSSWCYFPMILLPKIYSITLVLSISLPQQTAARAPSAMISLPTIQPDLSDYRQAPTPHAGSRASYRPQLAERHAHFNTAVGQQEAGDPKEVTKQDAGVGWTRSAPAMGTRWSEVFKSSWTRSQGLLRWSLVQGTGEAGQDSRVEADKGKWLQVDRDFDYLPQTPRPASAPQERRPSLMPLLDSSPSPPTARRLLTPLTGNLELTRSHTSPIPYSANRDRFPSSVSTLSTFPHRRDSNPTPSTPISFPLPTYASPSPRNSSNVHPGSSFSIGSPTPRPNRRSTVPDLPEANNPYVLPLPVIDNTQDLDPGPLPDFGFHFDTLNPFGSIYSSASQVSLARYPPTHASGSQVPLVRFGQSTTTLPGRAGASMDEPRMATRAERRMSRIASGAGVEDEVEVNEDGYETPRGSSGRNMSFQDFLADGPPSPGKGGEGGEKKRKGSGKKRDKW